MRTQIVNLTPGDEEAAPDGSPVGLYALLPPDGEPEIIHAAMPPGAPILELGCGAGRVTHALLALGHPVVAVDQSPAMLAFVQGAETVLSDIESLALTRRFEAVVLGSYLINTPDPVTVDLLLRSCRRHIAVDGSVLIERYDPAWAASLGESQGTHQGVWYALRDVRHVGAQFSAVMVYRIGERWFSHAFTARIIDDAGFEALLARNGLQLAGWLGEGRRWARAVAAAPAAGEPARP